MLYYSVVVSPVNGFEVYECLPFVNSDDFPNSVYALVEEEVETKEFNVVENFTGIDNDDILEVLFDFV